MKRNYKAHYSYGYLLKGSNYETDNLPQKIFTKEVINKMFKIGVCVPLKTEGEKDSRTVSLQKDRRSEDLEQLNKIIDDKANEAKVREEEVRNHARDDAKTRNEAISKEISAGKSVEEAVKAVTEKVEPVIVETPAVSVDVLVESKLKVELVDMLLEKEGVDTLDRRQEIDKLTKAQIANLITEEKVG